MTEQDIRQGWCKVISPFVEDKERNNWTTINGDNMSHGSEGSKGTTRNRYLQWMNKEPRTKSEMRSYMQENSREAGDVGIRRALGRPSVIKQTPGGFTVYEDGIAQESVAGKKELPREKGVVEKAHRDDEWPEMPMMQMPIITNLKREKG